MKFAWDGCSKLDCLCWGSSEALGSAFLDLCLWEFFFSPSLPFMGVMLFPSLRLGNAPGESGASLALLSLFILLLLPPIFFLSSSLFSLLLLLLFHPFSSSPAFHLFFHICFSFSYFLSFSPFPFLLSFSFVFCFLILFFFF